MEKPSEEDPFLLIWTSRDQELDSIETIRLPRNSEETAQDLEVVQEEEESIDPAQDPETEPTSTRLRIVRIPMTVSSVETTVVLQTTTGKALQREVDLALNQVPQSLLVVPNHQEARPKTVMEAER